MDYWPPIASFTCGGKPRFIDNSGHVDKDP